jgi:hypothetical protein
MRFINPFDTSRSWIKASGISLAIGIAGWSLLALTAEDMLPKFVVWPGIALFTLGWISLAFAILRLFVRVLSGRRS